MKRFLIALLLFMLIPATARGEELSVDEYNNYLSSYDLSFFESELDGETKSRLDELGISEFSFESLYSLDFKKVADILLKTVNGRIKAPGEGIKAVLVYIILSAFVKSLKSDLSDMNELYSTACALIVTAVLIVKISPSITAAAASINVSSDFIYAFIPVFCAIVAASGGITVSFSTNATLLMLSQGLTFLSSNIFIPAINCFLALSVCSSLRPRLGLSNLINALRRGFTTVLSFIAGAYVSVISVKTSASVRADMLGMRSLRFVISSAVPIVGGALSEGLVSIQAYSSLIKTSVGIVGIIAVSLVFLPSIIEITVWRIVLTVCSIFCEVFEDSAVSGVLRAFSVTLLIMNTVLILSALVTVVSIGILVASGS